MDLATIESFGAIVRTKTRCYAIASVITRLTFPLARTIAGEHRAGLQLRQRALWNVGQTGQLS